MNDDARIRELLRDAFRPPANGEPGRDLWPRMLRRLDQEHEHWSWVDWILAAVAGIWILVFPNVIPGVLYHL